MTLRKQVQFSGDIEWIDAFANEDYDRTAQQVAKLSYHDMYELLLLKSQWRQESQQMMATRQNDDDNHVEEEEEKDHSSQLDQDDCTQTNQDSFYTLS
ncbi:uncharacterized protein BX664DRAFT_362552 [Halteromyces radiatus]|uniref:uncharacterized protein n=1 Tax=Halteromyces radiatus TaxID=101107 RepID=UPI00221FE0B0|nr:uncharacterized protein BX664DRAFT_362552 [Halteromyces radiatus]KAI8077767.1 hypothetical protein BX664DRAFT_362552 [Halteromyces radiatus]